MKYYFKGESESPWLVEFYNKFIPFKTNGFLVEIGVGHTIKGIDRELPKNLTNFERARSNTADLLDLGWSGIYIEPVQEYCNEVKISQKHNLDRLQIINMGASDGESELELFLGDSFIPNAFGTQGYSWIGRTIKTQKTSKILEDNNCPKNIDIMSIDVEGFELNVIRGIDFEKHRPKLLICEIKPTPMDSISKLLPSSYKLAAHDNLNAIWVDEG